MMLQPRHSPATDRTHLSAQFQTMPFTRQISIERQADGGYVFLPPTLDQVAIADEVVFINNDDEAHWPGLVDETGKAPNPTTYFMRYQIPPQTSSTSWTPGVTGTVRFADSLDTRPTRPVGSIVVSDIPTGNQ